MLINNVYCGDCLKILKDFPGESINCCTKPYKEAHFATYPEKLVEPCIKAGCSEYIKLINKQMKQQRLNI